jgi:cytoskeletal protein RodZ
MADKDNQAAASPQDTVGNRLRLAREAAGLSRADIAARTKIAERHLAAIEEDRFADLASSTYAVGFSRAYARSVGLDEAEIGRSVRRVIDAGEDSAPRVPVTFEPGDPARIPGSRTAWLAGIAVLAVIAVLFAFWRSYVTPAVSLPDLTAPDLTADEAPASAAPSGAGPAAAQPPAGASAVVFTATAPRVWVKFSDAAGRQLLQKELAEGESYTLPADAAGPTIWTARPDALRITVAGRPVPPLADRQMQVKDVPVSAAALLARSAAAPAASAPAASPTSSPSPARPARAEPERPARRPAREERAAPALPESVPAVTPPAPAPAPAAPVAPPESTVSQ